VQEFIDFLGKQSPYDRLDNSDLARLGAVLKVEYFPAGSTIIGPGIGVLEYLAVIRTGVVTILDRSSVVDELGPGDTFGQFSVFSGLPSTLTAHATADTLLYLLPDPRLVVEHPDRLAFQNADRSVAHQSLRAVAATDSMMRSVTSFMSPVLWCEADTTIREAALAMNTARRSCILFRAGTAFGIMTDSDCRRMVATGAASADDPVHVIASSPAYTIGHRESAASALLSMVHHGVHHLVVTDDPGHAVGVCRVVDLSAADIRDPLTVRSAIEAARTVEQLIEATTQLRPVIVELTDAGIPPLRVGGLISAMVEATVEKCISWVAPFSAMSDDFSWLFLGSLARREPLPVSDVDTALVWRDDPARQDALLGVANGAEDVLTMVERTGLSRCPDGANASNPLFHHSHDDWLRRARGWVAHSDGPGALLLAVMLADSRPITGLLLGRSMERELRTIPGDDAFLRRALGDAIARKPPIGFVKDFVVEASGKHRGQVDLKRGGLGPTVAIGRWLALRTRSPIASTQERLQMGADEGLLTLDEAAQLQRAHREIYELIFTAEVESLRAGAPTTTFLDPRSLDSLSRRHLRQSFKAIASVQDRLEGEWLGRGR